VCPDNTTWSGTLCVAPPGNATAAERYFHQFLQWTDANGGNHFLRSDLGPANGAGSQPRVDVVLGANGLWAADLHFFGTDGAEVSSSHLEGWWSVDSEHTVITLSGLGIGYQARVERVPGVELHVSCPSLPDAFAPETVVRLVMVR
jgi:hypothetical protein